MMIENLIQENENLLVRAMLCLEDISIPKDSGRTVKDRDYYKNTEAFRKVKQWIEQNPDSSLEDFINLELLKNKELKGLSNQWRYLFAKYHEIMDFCSYGVFKWNEDDPASLLITSSTSIQDSCDNRELPLFLFYIIWKRSSEYLISIDEMAIDIPIGSDGKLRTKENWNKEDCFSIFFYLYADTYSFRYQLSGSKYVSLYVNSRITKKLFKNGWSYNSDKALYCNEYHFLMEHIKGRSLEREVEIAINTLNKLLESLEQALKMIL